MTTAQPSTPTKPISDAERGRRQEAIDFARANVELSGFKVTGEDNQRYLRYIDGEIELADILKSL